MYLLDTNICIYLIKKKSKSLQNRIEKEKPYTIAISAVSVAELEFGVAKSLYPEKNKQALLEFLSPFEIVPFSEIDCEAYGILRAYLENIGTPIGPYDLQIAAQCLYRDYCLITNNLKEFKRIKGLKIENWTKKPD
jgi:tRNA(fMet)-specific endonuclease VapC